MRATMALVALLIALSGAGLGKAQPRAVPTGPSFACNAPTQIEAIICHDAALSAADRRMSALYQTAKVGALNNGSNQAAAQRQWLKDRDRLCTSTEWKAHADLSTHGAISTRDCLERSYQDRLQALAVTNLLASPQQSLAELHALSPKAAPYYEALLAYATIDDPAQRARVVEAKLAPLYAAMSPELRQGLGYVGKAASTARGAASSDAGFAQFFDLSSMLGDVELWWPCAALVRRPGLVEGLGSIWGGAIDGQVPGSDCEEALPSPPELPALTRAAMGVQPPCEGTIRFSTGREYAKLEDAVRLHRRDVWRDRKGSPSAEEVKFRLGKATLIDRTSTALASYYVRYFQSGRLDAIADGRAATSALVSAAFGYCD